MKHLTTTIQRVEGNYSTTIPAAIIGLLKLEKGDVLTWQLDGEKMILEKKGV